MTWQPWLCPIHGGLPTDGDTCPICKRQSLSGEMAAMLRKLEWSGTVLIDGNTAVACPCCHGTHPPGGGPGPDGHTPGCDLDALLKALP